MEQGRPEDAAAQVAAALTEVALRLGGAWRIEISEDGQLALVPDDDHAQTPYIATVASIRVVKTFKYRNVDHTFSNRYHFDGGTPSDNTHWTTFSDAVVAAEKLIYLPYASKGAKITATVGYDGGSEIPVFNKTYTTDGTAAPTNWGMVPGDVAAIARYSTAYRSTKNHPIYLFNYFHTFGVQSNASWADALNSDQKALLNTYCNLWITGISDGTSTHHRSGPTGHLATGLLLVDNLTHRDLPR